MELRHLLKPLSIAQTTDSPGTRQPILARWARAIAADWEERGIVRLVIVTSPALLASSGVCHITPQPAYALDLSRAFVSCSHGTGILALAFVAVVHRWDSVAVAQTGLRISLPDAILDLGYTVAASVDAAAPFRISVMGAAESTTVRTANAPDAIGVAVHQLS